MVKKGRTIVPINTTAGDRTARRFGSLLGTLIKGESARKGAICRDMGRIICNYRYMILDRLVPASPDMFEATLRRTLTDIATASDIASGLNCPIKCELVPAAKKELWERLDK